jgi:hypothetical protein
MAGICVTGGIALSVLLPHSLDSGYRLRRALIGLGLVLAFGFARLAEDDVNEPSLVSLISKPLEFLFGMLCGVVVPLIISQFQTNP